jgi:hypothetical protein
MNDSELADAIVERLNALVRDPAVRADVGRLIEERVPVGEATAAHPSIQVQESAAGGSVLGFLGLLNGLIGTLPEGRLAGWGYVAAVFDDSGALERFRRTDAGPGAAP